MEGDKVLIVVLGILATITIVCAVITVICVIMTIVNNRFDVKNISDIALAQSVENDKKVESDNKEKPLKEKTFFEQQVNEMLNNKNTTVEGLPPTIIYL